MLRACIAATYHRWPGADDLPRGAAPLEAALVARTQELGRRFRIALAERQFAMLGGARRIAAGAALPAPSAVFPRYVDSAASA